MSPLNLSSKTIIAAINLFLNSSLPILKFLYKLKRHLRFENHQFQVTFSLITLAGVPAAIEYAGTSFVTTDPAAIIAPSPI